MEGSMTAFEYSRYDCPYPIRSDLPDTYRMIWAEIAKPGASWSGAERVAIAEATRGAAHCTYCAERKQAISPYAVGTINHSRRSKRTCG